MINWVREEVNRKMTTKQLVIGLVVTVILMTLFSSSYAYLEEVGLKTDRAIITTAVNDYWTRTSSVPLITSNTLKELSEGVSPADLQLKSMKRGGLDKLYKELVDIYGAEEVDANIFPLDKMILQSAGSLGKLKKENRIWLGHKSDPSFILCVDDVNSKEGITSFSAGGSLDTLTEKEVSLSTPTGTMTTPIDTTVDGAGNLIVGGSGTANIVVVSPNGDVTDVSDTNRSGSVEYVAGSSDEPSYIVTDGTTYNFKTERR